MRGFILVKGFAAKGVEAMWSLISDLWSWLGALYNHGLREIADRCAACVSAFIRTGLNFDVIEFIQVKNFSSCLAATKGGAMRGLRLILVGVAFMMVAGMAVEAATLPCPGKF